MVKQCILCAFKRGTSLKPLDQKNCKSYLMCSFCETLYTKAYGASKYSINEALQDPKNKPTAVTVTLQEKYQHIDDTIIAKWYKNVSKEIIRSFRTPSYIHGVFEHTKAHVVHGHFIICARPRPIAQCVAKYKKLGWVMTKPIFDMEEWSNYMYKDYDPETSLPPFKIVS